MLSINDLIWSLPILFMIHDFEEIILIEWWMRKNKGNILARFPKLGKALIDKLGSTNTAAFSAGVAEEFIIVCIVSLYSVMNGHYGLWFGLMVAFCIHLAVHIFQIVLYKGYVVASLTSCICLPISVFVLMQVYNQVIISNFLLWCILGLLIMVVNLNIIHKLMKPLQEKMSH